MNYVIKYAMSRILSMMCFYNRQTL